MTIIKRTIIEEYRELTEDIAVIKSCITSTERDLNKTINTFQPRELGAIDYSKPVVQTSCSQESLTEVYIKIHDLNIELQNLKIELDSLNKQRDDLEQTINDLGDIEKKVLMLKIKGCKNWVIAKQLNYSVKGIEKIYQRICKREREYCNI